MHQSNDVPHPLSLLVKREGGDSRKEFFRIDKEAIRAHVEKKHGVVEYVANPDALQYREGLTMSVEDQEFIEKVYQSEGAEEDMDDVVVLHMAPDFDAPLDDCKDYMP